MSRPALLEPLPFSLKALLGLLGLNPPKCKYPGETQEDPMVLHAVPGMMTVLDVCLHNALKSQLTSTLTSSHALLAAWLDLKQQAVVVLQELRPNEGDLPSVFFAAAAAAATSTTVTISRRIQVEGLARACLDTAYSAIELLTTDKLAQSANLSDPFEPQSSNSTSSATPSFFHCGHQSSSSSSLNQSGVPGPAGTAGAGSSSSFIQQSLWDTGRRKPLPQRPRDCWESPRLLCPDYVWADEVFQSCQKLLKLLQKDPAVAAALEYYSQDSAAAAGLHHHGNDSRSGGSSSGNTSGHPTRNMPLPRSAENEVTLLLQLLQIDIPTRLLQFRTCVEADAVVLKRLYLVKCEYRAPFRAFLEAHHSVLRAPSLDLVEECLCKDSKMAVKRRDAAKDNLQSLLDTPDFVQALELEQQSEEIEAGMANSLMYFCELARFLEKNRARIRAGVVPHVIPLPRDVWALQQRLTRLKGLICRSTTGHDTSTGIRPLLLDLQGVKRDEDEPLTNDDRAEESQQDGKEQNRVEQNLECLLQDLTHLAKLCENPRGSFCVDHPNSSNPGGGGSSSSKKDKTLLEIAVDLPASIARGCTSFDREMLRCQFLDWYDCVMAQHELVGRQDIDWNVLAEELRRAEMAVGLAAAPRESLELVKERVARIATDRRKRFAVLEEVCTALCLRELHLYVQVVEPPCDKPLLLQPTTCEAAMGVFGLPLLMAGETLPIG